MQDKIFSLKQLIKHDSLKSRRKCKNKVQLEGGSSYTVRNKHMLTSYIFNNFAFLPQTLMGVAFVSLGPQDVCLPNRFFLKLGWI